MNTIYGLGSAIVDLQFTVTDDFLTQQNVTKGTMTIIDLSARNALLQELNYNEAISTPGGSVANSLALSHLLGANTYLDAVISNDNSGKFFSQNTPSQLPEPLHTASNLDELPTAESFILITPDGERTMLTHLGVASHLSSQHIHQSELLKSDIIYTEGYIASISPNTAKEAHDTAAKNNIQVASSLSDVNMILYFKEALSSMLGNGIDHLFCNLEEAFTWANTDRLQVAINELKDIAPNLYITLGSKGVYLHSPLIKKQIDTTAVDQPLNTTGAGDTFAGTVLHGIISKLSLDHACILGNKLSTQVIQQHSARLNATDVMNILN